MAIPATTTPTMHRRLQGLPRLRLELFLRLAAVPARLRSHSSRLIEYVVKNLAGG